MHKYEPAHIERLLREERVKDIRPAETLKDAGLKPGQTLADVGCGPGFFTIPASRIVGPGGRVYAIDTEERMLTHLKASGPPDNVIIVKSGENSIPVEDSAADISLAAYVLHEAEDKVRFLKEIKRITRPGGIIAVIDWKKKAEEHGPPIEERLTEAEVIRLLEDAGFKGPRSTSMNNSHYRVIARRP